MRPVMRQNFLRVFLSMCAVSLLAGVVSAQSTVKVTGVGRVEYSWYSAETKEKALDAARRAALKKYAARLPTAKKRLLKSFEDLFYASVSDFVIAETVQQEKKDRSTKTFSIAIMAEVDPGAIDAFFIDNSAAGTQMSGESSDFGAMFIARREVSRTAYQAKETNVRETDSSAVLEEESADDGTSSVESSRARSIDVERTGGSTTRKSDAVEWEPDLALSEDVASAVFEHLIDAGFEPMETDQLEGVPYLDEIIDQLDARGRMPTRIRKAYQTAAIDEGWSFLGIGTIDVGTPASDTARGTVRVSAKVAFKVWMLTDGRAKAVGSVRPQVVYGTSPGDSEVASTNAYNAAVKLALETVVAQLQKKNLR